MKNFTQAQKYHHAAYAYVIMGIAYTIAGTVGMPPHDYGALIQGMMERKFPALAEMLGQSFPYATALWALLITLGILFFGLSYFIYYEYHNVVFVLTVIYFFRTIFSGRAAFLTLIGEGSHSMMMIPMFFMILSTFYLLLRAQYDWKP